VKGKYINLLKTVLKMDNYRIAAVESVGSKRFVSFNYDGN